MLRGNGLRKETKLEKTTNNLAGKVAACTRSIVASRVKRQFLTNPSLSFFRDNREKSLEIERGISR